MRRVIATLLTTALTAAALGATNPSATDAAVYEVTLRQAAPGSGEQRVALRTEGDQFVAGVTIGPLGPTMVDCAGLVRNGQAITGTLRISVGFDGSTPADGKPVITEYHLDAMTSDGKLHGTFEALAADRTVSGIVEGRVTAPPDLHGYWVMELQMENGRGTGTLGPKSWGERVYPKLYWRDGACVQSLIYGWGGRVQINYFESAITNNALCFDGKALTGALTVQPTGEAPGTEGGRTFLYTFDAAAVGRYLSGMFAKQIGDKAYPGGPIHGTVHPLPARPLDQAVYYLELHQAVSRTWAAEEAAVHKLQLMAFAPCVRGKFGAGVAYAAAWNHAYHDLDTAGLRLNGDALTGTLQVSMHPDPYMPPDRQPVAAVYRVEAKIIDGRLIQGTYTGMFKDRKVHGPLYGELLDQPAVPEPVAINLKLEEGVNGGAPWHRRTWVNFTAVNGQAVEGNMSNNKGGWKGTFRRAAVHFDGSVFASTIEGTVDETVGPEKGAYTFKLTGRVVGSQLIGTCDTYHDGKLTRSGTDFMGGFMAVPATQVDGAASR